MGIQLTVKHGAGVSRSYSLEAGQVVTLGRHINNTILVDDQHASRWHAVVVCDGNRWFLQNIGDPVNGTCVNGQRVEGQAELRHADEITVGDTQVHVSLPAAAPFRATNPTALTDTPLCPDELALIFGFVTQAIALTDHQVLIRRALETVQQRTQANVAGYLNLEDEPQAKVMIPETEQVDVALSRLLTRRVVRDGRSFWAASHAPAVLVDSLRGFTDALCVPVRTAVASAIDGGEFTGAIHLYKAVGNFSEQQQRFCDVFAGCLAGYLAALRSWRSLQAENARLSQRATAEDTIVGASPAMQKLRTQIGRAAMHRSTVLIRGETGVGKELVALELHRQSPRRDGPLVVVNCASLSGTLVESQLFGHRKGAFTGADRDRAGLFEEADEGTLFLDEVGEVPLECQAKILRVIEGKGFRPVGASGDVHVDVRIIAATNRDLEADVGRGKFRQDLLYRLQVIQLHVSPLRERSEDIPALVESFLGKLARNGRRIRITEAALLLLQRSAWPGNVRQLLAVLESAVAMSDGTVLGVQDLSLPPPGPGEGNQPLNLAELEIWALREALRRTKGNVSQTAKLLGVSRDTVTAKMKQSGISRESL